MRRRLLLTLGPLALIAALGLAMVVLTTRSHEHAGRIYSVSAVLLGAHTHPDAWIGRTVRVRGYTDVLGGVFWVEANAGHRQARPAFLLWGDAGGTGTYLPVAYGGAYPVSAHCCRNLSA